MMRSEKTDPGLPGWLLAAGLLLGICVLLQLAPADWRAQLRYERIAVSGGEWWRLLSANVVHLGWGHLALNSAGLALIAWIFGPDHSVLEWAVALLLSGLAASLGVHALTPGVFWLVGLSGALHGLFVFGVVGWLRQGDRLAWLLLAGLILKLGWERYAGGLPLSADMVGGDIVTDAHLWGAAGGLLASAITWMRWRGRLARL